MDSEELKVDRSNDGEQPEMTELMHDLETPADEGRLVKKRGRPRKSDSVRVSKIHDSLYIFQKDEAYVAREHVKLKQSVGSGASRAMVLRPLISDGIKYRDERQFGRNAITKAGREVTEAGLQHVYFRDFKPQLDKLLADVTAVFEEVKKEIKGVKVDAANGRAEMLNRMSRFEEILAEIAVSRTDDNEFG